MLAQSPVFHEPIAASVGIEREVTTPIDDIDSIAMAGCLHGRVDIFHFLVFPRGGTVGKDNTIETESFGVGLVPEVATIEPPPAPPKEGSASRDKG